MSISQLRCTQDTNMNLLQDSPLIRPVGSLLTNEHSIQEEQDVDKQEIRGIIHPKRFCFLDFSLRMWKLRYIYLLMSNVIVKNDILRWGRNGARGYLKTGSWGEYLGPRGMRMASGEGSTMRNFIVYTVHLLIRAIKSRRLRWAGHEARMEEDRSAFKTLTGNCSRDLQENLL